MPSMSVTAQPCPQHSLCFKNKSHRRLSVTGYPPGQEGDMLTPCHLNGHFRVPQLPALPMPVMCPPPVPAWVPHENSQVHTGVFPWSLLRPLSPRKTQGWKELSCMSEPSLWLVSIASLHYLHCWCGMHSFPGILSGVSV